MSKTINCVHVSCDHCGCGEYYMSLNYAKNVGWDIDANVDEETLDLCPKCSAEWHKIADNFLNCRKEEDKNSIAISKALDVAYSHGQTDGAHHKAWVIDQMVRRLLGDNYDEWIKNYKHEDGDDEAYSWDVGIAP